MGEEIDQGAVVRKRGPHKGLLLTLGEKPLMMVFLPCDVGLLSKLASAFPHGTMMCHARVDEIVELRGVAQGDGDRHE